jgi:yjeF C-terminal region, hydroxyethylthiazole kinase-related/yjeF N-terminal region
VHVVSREEMQAIDRYTMQQIGLAGPLLMENAGRAIFNELSPDLRYGEQVLVIIGKGNNGGDGFVVARLMLDSQVDLSVWLLPDRAKIKGGAAVHMNAFVQSGGSIRNIREEKEAFSQAVAQADLIVDALLGTGIHGEPYPEYLETIEQINRSDAEVVSVDLPSGVPADGGTFSYPAVSADRTLTLECPKLAQFVQPAARCFGSVRVLPIGIPQLAVTHTGVKRSVRTEAEVRRTLPRRDPFSHKGSHGRGLIIAGSAQMSGAAFFTAKAALRSGIGLLKLSVPETVRPVIAAQLPEVMYMPRHLLDLAGLSGVAIGPGLGREPGAGELVRQVLEEDDCPCVIDADGIYHLSRMKELLLHRKNPVVLTPHPGEMAMLLDKPVAEIESDRFHFSEQFAGKYGVYLVLKGKYTIITAPDGRQIVNPTGNASLAKGGSGDVLTGIVFAFLLQNKDPLNAVCNAVYLHGALADDLVRTDHSQIDVLASDLIDRIPALLHRLS